MKTLLLIMATAICAYGQPKLELKEFTGLVKGIRTGWNFAYSLIEIETEKGPRFFKIEPNYGQTVISKIQINQTLTLRAMVNEARWEKYKANGKLATDWGFFLWEQVVEVKLGDEWIKTPAAPRDQSVFFPGTMKVFIEKRVHNLYAPNGVNKALILDDGVIAYNIFGRDNFFKNYKQGSIASFCGYEHKVEETYLYPIEGVKQVYSFMELSKTEGKIESFVYKQNYARIGLVVNNSRLCFPTTYAESIQKFANDRPVTIYHNGHEDKMTNSLPTIHALIQDRDTVLIPMNYYGGPDENHEHKPAELDGKISRVTRNDKGRIISLIMGNDCYVEVSPKMAEQLSSYLTRGNELKVSGDERIKREGEIYEQDYRIITPKKIVAGGKEFILNQ